MGDTRLHKYVNIENT